MKFFFLLLVFSSSWFWASAQNLDPLVFTTGRSYQTGAGNRGQTDFLLWQPGNLRETFGEKFAVYVKEGGAASTTSYRKISLQQLQTSPRAILTLLKVGTAIDHDGADLAARIAALRQEAVGKPVTPDTDLATELNLSVAKDLSQIISAAKTSDETLQSLLSLGRTHPGVMMALGHAFSYQVPGRSRHTYEVRLVDSNGADRRVIGRVTLDGSGPINLPRPGPVVAVSHTNELQQTNPDHLSKQQLANSAKDHLMARFRWGLDDSFREQLPRLYGFNLYRVPEKSVADPASVKDERSLLALTNAVRVNRLPVSVTEMMTVAEAADLTNSPASFFYHDDKSPPNDRFKDGEAFYYYLAARDIAGKPGPLSAPTLVTMCDTLPPDQVSISSVENVFDFNSGGGTAAGRQFLQVVIEQHPDSTPAENKAVAYQIYRWQRADDWMRHGGLPNFNLVGKVNHVAGQKFVTWNDDDGTDLDTDGLAGPDTGAPVAQNEDSPLMGKTIWYTVRAVDGSACAQPNLSGHSGAVFGVLRDRVGPGKATGSVSTTICIPQVSTSGVIYLSPRENITRPDDIANGGTVMGVARVKSIDNQLVLEPKVKGFRLQIDNKETQTQERIVFYDRSFLYKPGEREKRVKLPSNPLLTGQRLRIQSCLTNGALSEWTTVPVNAAGLTNPDDFFGASAAFLIATATTVTSPPSAGAPQPHDVATPEGARIAPTVTVSTDEKSRELRIYRRVNGGTLELLQKITGKTLPDPYRYQDLAPPQVHGTEFCYYAMTLDEHANPSALVELGCVQAVANALPQAQLTTPKYLSTNNGEDLFSLSWTCDPVGVDRFEVWVAHEQLDDPALSSGDLSPAGPITSRESFPAPANLENRATQLLYTKHLTKRLATGFGDGGEFVVNVGVPAGEKLHFFVRAAGEPVKATADSWITPRGESSNVVTAWFRGLDPVIPETIPWPDRSLPPVAKIDKLIQGYQPGQGPIYAQPVPEGQISTVRAATIIMVGSYVGSVRLENDSTVLTPGAYPGPQDPMSFLFPIAGSGPGGEIPNQGFVVYRHQVPSARFPNAKPHLVQVSPLHDRIAVMPPLRAGATTIVDPYFLSLGEGEFDDFGIQLPAGGTFDRDPTRFQRVQPLQRNQLPSYLQFTDRPKGLESVTLWVKDTMPITKGAKYQYYLVHFGERGEPIAITPTNHVQH